MHIQEFVQRWNAMHPTDTITRVVDGHIEAPDRVETYTIGLADSFSDTEKPLHTRYLQIIEFFEALHSKTYQLYHMSAYTNTDTFTTGRLFSIKVLTLDVSVLHLQFILQVSHYIEAVSNVMTLLNSCSTIREYFSKKSNRICDGAFLRHMFALNLEHYFYTQFRDPDELKGEYEDLENILTDNAAIGLRYVDLTSEFDDFQYVYMDRYIQKYRLLRNTNKDVMDTLVASNYVLTNFDTLDAVQEPEPEPQTSEDESTRLRSELHNMITSQTSTNRAFAADNQRPNTQTDVRYSRITSPPVRFSISEETEVDYPTYSVDYDVFDSEPGSDE